LYFYAHRQKVSDAEKTDGNCNVFADSRWEMLKKGIEKPLGNVQLQWIPARQMLLLAGCAEKPGKYAPQQIRDKMEFPAICKTVVISIQLL
jgi:hypothetical protein